MEAHALHGSATAEAFDPTVLLRVLSDVKAGDFTARMPVHWTGVEGKIADGLNEIIGANQALGDRARSVSAESSARRASSPSAPRSRAPTRSGATASSRSTA